MRFTPLDIPFEFTDRAGAPRDEVRVPLYLAAGVDDADRALGRGIGSDRRAVSAGRA
ncbi:hypothetical protein GCM10009838_61610 [Catenulispora subtropica]|uniref:Uncharacterized protein n=1 Tax=Catenulispora subtropica TaxID=450798 RepID=A0ABN2SPD4_9ACTN